MKRLWARLEEASPVIPFIRNNIGWIATSLILAVMIWVVATLDENPIEQREFVRPIPIEFKEDENDEVILRSTSTLTTEARVTLRAPVNSWLELIPEDIEVWADLRDLPVGVHTVELQASINDNGPSGRVISISPSTINVEIVPFQERRFSVEIVVSTRFSLAEYEVDVSTCEGQEVVVSGPTDLVNDISKAELRLNLLRPSSINLVRNVTLLDNEDNDYLPSTLANLQVTPDRLSCQVGIQQTENVLRVVPNVVGAPPPGYVIDEITHTPEQVLVRGDSTIIETLNGIVQTTEVDTSNQTGQFSREVDVELPAGITTSQRITVTINIVPVQTTLQFPEVPVQITNLDPAFEVSFIPETVTVTIEGPEPLVQNVSIEDFSVTVDASGLSEGTYTGLPAQVNFFQANLQEAVSGATQPNNVSVIISLIPTETPETVPTSSLRIWGKTLP